MIGAQNHGIGPGSFLALPAVLSDQKNVYNAAAGAADQVRLFSDSLRRQIRQKAAQPGAKVGGGLGVVDFSQHLLEQGGGAQKKNENQGKKQAHQLHECAGEGIVLFSLHGNSS